MVKRDLNSLLDYKIQIDKQLQEIAKSKPSSAHEAQAHEALKDQMLEELWQSRVEVVAEIRRLKRKK